MGMVDAMVQWVVIELSLLSVSVWRMSKLGCRALQ